MDPNGITITFSGVEAAGAALLCQLSVLVLAWAGGRVSGFRAGRRSDMPWERGSRRFVDDRNNTLRLP